MKIKCPDCSTSYDIKPAILGTEGRSVKCARCGNRWFVAPKKEAKDDVADDAAIEEDEDNWAADEAEEEGKTAVQAETGSDLDEEEDEDEDEDEDQFATAAKPAAAPAPAKAEAKTNKPPADPDDEETGEQPIDIETMANRPKIKVNPNKFKRNRLGAIINWLMRRNYRRVAGVTLFGSSIAICALVFLVRDEIVKQAPDLASLFEAIGLEVNLRGLEFRDLRTFRELEDGEQVLVVEGSIRNIKPEDTPVPAVRLSLRGGDLQEIYAWTVEPRTKTLKGLDETRFRTILTDPPADAADIQVRFVERGQRQVVLD